MSPIRLGRAAYWLLGWLLTLVTTYAGTQFARARGLVAPIVPGPAALVLGLVLGAIGLTLARRFGRTWQGVLVAGLGVLSVGLGLASLVR